MTAAGGDGAGKGGHEEQVTRPTEPSGLWAAAAPELPKFAKFLFLDHWILEKGNGGVLL